MKELLYDWFGANVWLFYAANGWHNDALDAAMRLGTTLGDHERFPLYLAVLACIGYTRLARGADPQRWLGVLAVFATAYLLDGWIVGGLKHALDFPRPLAALPPASVYVVGEAEYRYSLPSGHAVFAVTCAASLWPLWSRTGRTLAVLFVLWVGASRVSVGAHFPADVVAGLLLGLGVVLPLRLALRALLRTFDAGVGPAITQSLPKLFSHWRKH